MRTLAFGALFVGLIAACGGGSNGGKKVTLVDSGSGSGGDLCNVLMQTGCASNEMCTWIVDSADMTTSVGHIGCAPAGTMAVDAMCTRGQPGATGYDDCAKGNYCFGPDTGGAGVCKQICDLAGGTPMCASGYACSSYDGIFGPEGMRPSAGVCDKKCNPLTENNFLAGSGSQDGNRTTFGCGSGYGSGSNAPYQTYGCYGYGDDGTYGGSKWTCTRQLNPTRVHRAECATTTQPGDRTVCSPDGMGGYVNGCAAGYEPVFLDAEGSTKIDCMAVCAPANCYNAGSGVVSNPMCNLGSNVRGDLTSGHECNTANFRYSGSITLTTMTATPTFTGGSAQGGVGNGEQCYYSWRFEVDTSGMIHPSETSDSVGFCIDHTKYTFPRDGSASDTTWPRCDLIGLYGSDGTGYNVGSNGADASYFGCVDHTLATTQGIFTFNGKKAHPPETSIRLPYHKEAKAAY